MKNGVCYIVAFVVITLLGMTGCNNGDDGEPEVIVATSPPSVPTATSLPTRDVSLIRPTMTPLPLTVGGFVLTATPDASTSPSMPVVVQEDIHETAHVNKWVHWYPPDGWETAVGPDGVFISPDLNNPSTPFALLRQWASPVDINGWQNYLPMGTAEPNGHVQLLLAGRTWDSVFILCPEYACRAMFAVTTNGNVHLSLLVFVPLSVDITSTADPRITLYGTWDEEAAKLNATLQTLNIIEPAQQ